MKLFKKGESRWNKATQELPMGRKTKKAFTVYAVLAYYMVFGTTIIFAADDPAAVINNLLDFISGLIKAIGIIMPDSGIAQVGSSPESHDPSQRANGFPALADGVMITFAKEILTLITG